MHRAQLYNAVGVTSLYSHNVCFLFSADTLHNGSVCSTDASVQDGLCASGVCIYSCVGKNGTVLESRTRNAVAHCAQTLWNFSTARSTAKVATMSSRP